MPEIIKKKIAMTGLGDRTIRGGESMTEMGGVERRILVVDDDDSIRLMVRAGLKRTMRVDLAMNGRQAYELFRANSYDAVLSDVEMPEMNGIELCQRLRRDERYEGPIIIMTGSNLDNVLPYLQQRPINAYGPDEIFTKPFDINLLRASLEKRMSVYVPDMVLQA
jgi:CheY-like chemotaxis protein